MCGSRAKCLFSESLISVVGQVYTSIPASLSLLGATTKRTVRPGCAIVIDFEDCRRSIACQRSNVGKDSARSWWSLMATADSADVPNCEQEGTYTARQTVTCHYHVYAPTTVHVNSGIARCVTESSSATSSTAASSPPTSVSQGQDKTEVHTKKRAAFLQWLIVKLILLLQKVSHRDAAEVVASRVSSV